MLFTDIGFEGLSPLIAAHICIGFVDMIVVASLSTKTAAISFSIVLLQVCICNCNGNKDCPLPTKSEQTTIKIVKMFILFFIFGGFACKHYVYKVKLFFYENIFWLYICMISASASAFGMILK